MFWVEKVIGEVWLSSALLISTGLMRKLNDFGILHSLHAETVSSAASIYANRGWSDSPLSVWNVSSAVVNARLASHPLNRQCSEVSFRREHCGGAMKTPMSPIIEDDKLYDVRMQVEHAFLSASSRWSKPQRTRRCGRRPGCTWAAEYNGWPPPHGQWWQSEFPFARSTVFSILLCPRYPRRSQILHAVGPESVSGMLERVARSVESIFEFCR